MIKIEKIKNGYILEIEELLPINTSMDKQIDGALDMMKKFMPEIQKLSESDPTLLGIQNQFEKSIKKYEIPPISNDKKLYFSTFKSLLAYINLLTDELDETGILINPDSNLNEAKKTTKKKKS